MVVQRMNFRSMSLNKMDLNVIAFEFARVYVISVERRVFWVSLSMSSVTGF